ncbi:hypothetical protein M9H77_32153 [Catharanthus roseus]|uniref:Uncharacterized protein n=1 Tax=Catharanthus roseus TaxID=4058 RepID=A0ACC0A322_CATRO|nr:hypothetical protein M9H77_32153 [Catharanthus roseus]
MDESSQISHKNHIHANHLDRPVLGILGQFIFLRIFYGRIIIPILFFISKTICNKRPIESIRISLGFSACFFVERKLLSGGLALFWYSDLVNLNILSSSMGHIDAQIKPFGSIPMWRFIGFYGNPSSEARNHSWTLLWRLKNMHSLHCLCGGDFNEKILPEKLKALEILQKQRGLPSYSNRLKDAYWKTRSCISRLKEGDRNTSYFHHKASQRKKKNTIDPKKLGGLGFQDPEYFNIALLYNQGLLPNDMLGSYTLDLDPVDRGRSTMGGLGPRRYYFKCRDSADVS